MDAEKRARRQSRRVIISEAIMVLAVVATVSILAFVVSGYWLSSDFTIERQGLLQIYSSPTGADVEVDGNPSSWLQRTNTSKNLSAGEHTITLTKDGYDSWSRTVNIAEGLLYRLHYPRLFLKNRTNESACEFSGNFATVSPDRNTMLLGFNTTTWQTFNLDGDSAKPQPLDLSKVLPFSSLATDATTGLFSGHVKSARWATDNEHVLLEITGETTTPDTTPVTTTNWLVLNIKNPSNSINLTKEFNADFTEVEILDSSASNLLVLLNGALHRIDAGAKQISAILAANVTSFDHYNQDVIYSTPEAVNLLKLSSGEVKELKNFKTPAASDASETTDVSESTDASEPASASEPAKVPNKVIATKFYDDEYYALVNDNSVTLYLKKDFEEKSTFSLTFSPEQIKVGQNGDFIAVYTGGRIATLDMEAMELTEWSTDTDSFGWLDGSMVYAVKDGALGVWDFNGLNPRTLAINVSSHFPVTITQDRYLYYFKDGTLIREYLTER